MNRRSVAALAGAGALLLALAGCSSGAGGSGAGYYGSSSSSSSSSSGSSASGPLKTGSTTLGAVIQDSRGMTVYMFDKDTAGASASACTGVCVSQWPAVTTSASTPSAVGVTGTLGTIAAANGGKQVTLNGHPLYTYAGDANPGDVNGQGTGGIWWVVAPTGVKITSTSGSSPSGSSAGHGY